MRRITCILQIGALCALATTARAQADAKARAEALFEEAQALMKKGELVQACPKFAASQKLDPAVGTLLNLATCYERQGKTASAWASFHEAETAASRANQQERAAFAHKRAAALEKKLSRVVIRVAQTNANLEVKLDGEVLDSSAWNDPLPVDPGQHRIEVSSPGKRAWSTTLDVGSEPAQSDVAVPELVDEPAVEHAPLPVVAEIAPPPAPRASSPLRPIGIVVGAVGLVGVGLGIGFGLNAKSKNDEALTHCPQSPQCSDQLGVDLTHEAQVSATASTISFVVGGVALATGVTLFLVAPKTSRQATARLVPLLGPGLGGAALGGAF